MLSAKDAFALFRSAAWRTREEQTAFLQAVTPVSTNDAIRWLGAIAQRGGASSGKAVAEETAAQEQRARMWLAVVEGNADPQLGVAAARALKTCDAAVRSALMPYLLRSSSTTVQNELVEVLRSPEAEARNVAVQVLQQIGGKAVLEALGALVRDPSFGARIDAMDAIVPKAQHHAVGLLGDVLAAGRPHERGHVLKLVADRRYFGRAPELAAGLAVQALRDPDERIVVQALAVLATLVDETVFFAQTESFFLSPSLNVQKGAIQALRAIDTPRAADLLREKFRKGPDAIRLTVIEVIGTTGNAASLPLLVDALKHRNLAIRSQAADALVRLASNGRVDPARSILWLLRSTDVNVRRLAAEIANHLKDPQGELTPRLLKYLRDEDWWVRERTMDALVEMSGRALAPFLLEYLRDPAELVRRYAVQALVRTKEPRAAKALLECAASDASWWVREEAIGGIAQLGVREAIGPLADIGHAQPETRLAICAALVTLKAREAADAVAHWLEDEDADVRRTAIETLEELGAEPYAHLVEARQEDPSPEVRRAARTVLGRLNIDAGDVVTFANTATLETLLIGFHDADGDDLILLAGSAPFVKRAGRVLPLPGGVVMSARQLQTMLAPIVRPQHVEQLEKLADVDVSYDMKSRGLRFRVNIFQQAGGIGAVFRWIRSDALLLVMDNLGLPPVVASFADYQDGLVLIGGPTGSGKSTTLGALVDRINRTSSRHIVTLEDPIETVHKRERSIITQRELGRHTRSFGSALRATLRQDPDVIVVGELRDAETIAFAVTAAETGHLVLGTVHAASADTAIERVINAFPLGQQQQIRAMMAENLRGILCQRLLRAHGRDGRVLAAEVMVNNDAIANMIRKSKTFQIPQVIATSRSAGMQGMDAELARLVRDGVVAFDEAYLKATDKKAFETLARGASVGVSSPPSGGTSVPPSMAPPAPSGRPSAIPRAV